MTSPFVQYTFKNDNTLIHNKPHTHHQETTQIKNQHSISYFKNMKKHEHTENHWRAPVDLLRIIDNRHIMYQYVHHQESTRLMYFAKHNDDKNEKNK